MGCLSMKLEQSQRNPPVHQTWEMRKTGISRLIWLICRIRGNFDSFIQSIFFSRRVEFSTPAYNLLNALEKIGYRWNVDWRLLFFFGRNAEAPSFISILHHHQGANHEFLNTISVIRVVTSSSFISGQQKFSTKDFIWTLYRSSYEADMGWRMRATNSYFSSISHPKMFTYIKSATTSLSSLLFCLINLLWTKILI